MQLLLIYHTVQLVTQSPSHSLGFYCLFGILLITDQLQKTLVWFAHSTA